MSKPYVPQRKRAFNSIKPKTGRSNVFCHCENKYKPIRFFSFYSVAVRCKNSEYFCVNAVCDECLAKGLSLDKLFTDPIKAGKSSCNGQEQLMFA